MREPPAPASPSAAGFIVMLAILIGAIAGAIAHQPTIGFLAGVAIGTAIGIVLWLRDRRRVGR